MNPTLGKIIETLAVQQDYLWFCALLLWVAMGASLAAARRSGGPAADLAWPLLTLVSGAGIALTELIAHVLPPGGPNQEFVWRDLVLFTLQFIQALAPAGYVLARQDRARRWRGWTAVASVVALVSLVRRQAFLPVDVFAHTCATILGILIVRQLGEKTPRLAWASLLAVAAFLAGTTGIFSEVLFQQRRYVELSGLALPSVLLQAGLAFLWIIQLLPGGLPGISAGADGVKKRPAPWLWPAIGLWLVAGFVTAWLTGRTARTGFEDSLLARARVCTAMLHPEGLEAILQPAFRVENFDTVPQPSGRGSLIARSSYLPAAARQTRHDLLRIQEVNPDIYWAYFMTLRSGLLVAPALQENLPAKKDVIVVQRPAGARDLVDWATRRSYVEGPLITDYGEVLRVCAPVTNRAGQMAGWLTLETGATEWTKVQSTARFQTFALMGVGSGMMLLILVLRQRTAAQEMARRQALSAAAADQAKTVFLAKVSHELRTPVQSILGYGELLQSHPGAPKHGQWLAAIASQSRLLIRLVNDLIDLSAIQSGAFRLAAKPVNAGALVQQAAESMRGLAAAKHLELVIEISPAVPAWLELDEERIRQLVINLIGNAIKFTDAGHVRVRLEAAPGAGDVELVLTVADTGCGISAEDQARLFMPFQRLDRHAGIEGAGLGLALCLSLCEKMGGALSVQSAGTGGSVFTARLRTRAAAAPLVFAEPTPAQTLAGRRILVADDNPLVAELYLAALRGAGAWCERASTGLEAVGSAAAGRFEVVIMDVSMPGLDGYTASRQIRAADPGVRIVGVSAHAGPEDQDLAVAAGMEVLLVKPVVLKDLLSSVAGRAVVEGEKSPADLALFRRLEAQFDRELPGLCSAIRLAAGAGDTSRLRERVHYLKNSADVVRIEEISLLCARVESATVQAATTATPELEALLAVLDRRLAAPLSGTPPATQPNP